MPLPIASEVRARTRGRSSAGGTIEFRNGSSMSSTKRWYASNTLYFLMSVISSFVEASTKGVSSGGQLARTWEDVLG